MLTAALAADVCKGGTPVYLASIQEVSLEVLFLLFQGRGRATLGVFDLMVRRVGIEPTTYCLKGSYSTS